MKKTDKEVLCKAIDAAILALDDWINTYAEDFCDEAKVAEAKARLNAQGTIAYLTDTVKQCREARKILNDTK
jgi:hypothetical protein